jgi:transitional endoplasmic reticulum ATPase
MREVMVQSPNIRWEDIGGLDEAQAKLKEGIELPLKNPDAFRRLGIRPAKGFLLYGPPGTGKTLLAKAVARESEANFIATKSSDLLSKWYGESEQQIARLFARARQVAPTVIFIDEIDSLAPGARSRCQRTASDRARGQHPARGDGWSGGIAVSGRNRRNQSANADGPGTAASRPL